MGSGEFERDCSGKQCGYAIFSGEIGCTDGGNYLWAKMLQPQESTFHDAALVKASKDINDILEPIKDARGRRLSFLFTPVGVMLAWVSHDLKIPEDAVTGDSPVEEQIKALRLIEPPKSD